MDRVAGLSANSRAPRCPLLTVGVAPPSSFWLQPFRLPEHSAEMACRLSRHEAGSPSLNLRSGGYHDFSVAEQARSNKKHRYKIQRHAPHQEPRTCAAWRIEWERRKKSLAEGIMLPQDVRLSVAELSRELGIAALKSGTIADAIPNESRP